MDYHKRQARLLFGTAGVPPSAPRPNSVAGIRQIRSLGLDCMELDFVRSVTMGDRTAAEVARAAVEEKVQLSVHAPYYINLNADDAGTVKDSRTRILKAARVGWKCGARHVVFHAGYYQGYSAEVTYVRIRGHILELSQQLRQEGIRMWLRPETMGRRSQFGSLDEILELSSELEGIAPCIDFAHLHARSGRDNSYEEFVDQLQRVEGRLGRNSLDDTHIHISGIEYGPQGERRHLMLGESDLQYEALLQALIDCEVRGQVVCESPNTEQDALLLQQAYRRLSGRLEQGE